MDPSDENHSQDAYCLPAHLTRAPEPWERDPRESDRSFALFSLYRQTAYPEAVPGNMGKYHPRHMANFAQHVGLTAQYLYNLASNHSWSARCAAYDMIVDRQRVRADLGDVERMRDDQRTEYAEMRETARLIHLRLREALESGAMQIKPSEYVTWLKALHEGERLLNGQATAVTETRSLTAVVSLQGAPPDVIEWYRKDAQAKLEAGNPD